MIFIALARSLVLVIIVLLLVIYIVASYVIDPHMVSVPNFDSRLPRDCASCTGDRSYAVSLLTVCIFIRLNHAEKKVSCRWLCSNVYKMIDFWYLSLVHYYANIQMSQRNIIQPRKFKTKLLSARLTKIVFIIIYCIL